MCFSFSHSISGFAHLTKQTIYNHFISLLSDFIFQKPFYSSVCLFLVSGNWLQLLQNLQNFLLVTQSKIFRQCIRLK